MPKVTATSDIVSRFKVVSIKILKIPTKPIERRLIIMALETNATPMSTRLYNMAARKMNETTSATKGSSKIKPTMSLASTEEHNCLNVH